MENITHFVEHYAHDYLEKLEHFLLCEEQSDAFLVNFLAACSMCSFYRGRVSTVKTYLETFIACALLHFGGKSLTGVLLGQSPSWMNNSIEFPVFVIAWLVVYFSFGDIYWKTIFKLPLFHEFLELFHLIEYAHAITHAGVDEVLWNKLIPKSAISSVLCGVLSGSGGPILGEWIGVFRSPSFTVTSTPEAFDPKSPHGTYLLLKTSFFSVLYYALINPSGFFPWSEVHDHHHIHSKHLIIISAVLLNFIISELVPSLHIFHFLSESLAHLTIEPSPDDHHSHGHHHDDHHSDEKHHNDSDNHHKDHGSEKKTSSHGSENGVAHADHDSSSSVPNKEDSEHPIEAKKKSKKTAGKEQEEDEDVKPVTSTEVHEKTENATKGLRKRDKSKNT